MATKKENVAETKTETTNENRIMLEREIVKSTNGKEYANYFVRGSFNVRGEITEKKIRMKVPTGDVTMYDVLDMVFEDRKAVELIKIAKVTRDISTGRKNTTYRYEVVNSEGDLRARVLPEGESNGALLDKLYKDMKKDILVEEIDNEEHVNQ